MLSLPEIKQRTDYVARDNSPVDTSTGFQLDWFLLTEGGDDQFV